MASKIVRRKEAATQLRGRRAQTGKAAQWRGRTAASGRLDPAQHSAPDQTHPERPRSGTRAAQPVRDTHTHGHPTPPSPPPSPRRARRSGLPKKAGEGCPICNRCRACVGLCPFSQALLAALFWPFSHALMAAL